MNGLDVFKHLKETSPRTRVIVMTGFGLQEMINEALSLGAFADVKKPFDLSLIYDLVDRALKSRAS
jgi:DNA-binding NtrC family response regulator